MINISVDNRPLYVATPRPTNVTATTKKEEIVFEGGKTGPMGPPGPGDLSYSQAFNSDQVIVNHLLGKKPAVTVLDSAGDEVEGAVNYLDNNTLELIFSTPFSGVVVCN